MKSVDELTRRLEEDPRNAEYTRRDIPPVYQLHKEARILIIGQAPGKKVEESLIPFNDKSGEKLMDWMGIDRDIFYSRDIAIMPMDFYFPGKSVSGSGDKPPRRFIAQEYHPEILRYMDRIQLTILIGKYAIDYYLGKEAKRNLTETVRAYQEYLPKYFPIVHPSPLNFRWQGKNPWFMEEVVPVLRRRVTEILEK